MLQMRPLLAARHNLATKMLPSAILISQDVPERDSYRQRTGASQQKNFPC